MKDNEVKGLMKKRGKDTHEILVAKKALRERFLKLPTVVTDEELKWLVFFLFTTLFVFDILNIVLRFYNCPWIRYVRGFLLDMLGNTMFADSSGDGIPLWYLGMIENLEEPRNYNWGGAVLAYLYRNLCLASSPSCHQMHGPTMLLQHWSWTRFQIHRPLPGSKPNWGAETEDTCPAFADMWKGPHNWENSSHGGTSGPSIPRNQLQ